ncbi:MAG: hypothetical protein Q9208_004409 [Pyrenodesmia sp. 3 TL-2023]
MASGQPPEIVRYQDGVFLWGRQILSNTDSQSLYQNQTRQFVTEAIIELDGGNIVIPPTINTSRIIVRLRIEPNSLFPQLILQLAEKGGPEHRPGDELYVTSAIFRPWSLEAFAHSNAPINVRESRVDDLAGKVFSFSPRLHNLSVSEILPGSNHPVLQRRGFGDRPIKLSWSYGEPVFTATKLDLPNLPGLQQGYAQFNLLKDRQNISVYLKRNVPMFWALRYFLSQPSPTPPHFFLYGRLAKPMRYSTLDGDSPDPFPIRSSNIMAMHRRRQRGWPTRFAGNEEGWMVPAQCHPMPAPSYYVDARHLEVVMNSALKRECEYERGHNNQGPTLQKSSGEYTFTLVPISGNTHTFSTFVRIAGDTEDTPMPVEGCSVQIVISPDGRLTRELSGCVLWCGAVNDPRRVQMQVTDTDRVQRGMVLKDVTGSIDFLDFAAGFRRTQKSIRSLVMTGSWLRGIFLNHLPLGPASLTCSWNADLYNRTCINFSLNGPQSEALLQCIKLDNRGLNGARQALCQGPPGTGKTQLIVALIYYCLLNNHKVLITAASNYAVRVISTRLKSELARLACRDYDDKIFHIKTEQTEALVRDRVLAHDEDPAQRQGQAQAAPQARAQPGPGAAPGGGVRLTLGPPRSSSSVQGTLSTEASRRPVPSRGLNQTGQQSSGGARTRPSGFPARPELTLEEVTHIFDELRLARDSPGSGGQQQLPQPTSTPPSANERVTTAAMARNAADRVQKKIQANRENDETPYPLANKILDRLDWYRGLPNKDSFVARGDLGTEVDLLRSLMLAQHSGNVREEVDTKKDNQALTGQKSSNAIWLQLQKFYLRAARAVIVTADSSNQPMLMDNIFQIVLIDEAAQMKDYQVANACVRNLQGDYLQKQVLLGDPQQLPPAVPSAKENEFAPLIERGFMAWQSERNPVFLLNIQYRAHPHISEFTSAAFYGGLLQDHVSVQDPQRPLYAAWQSFSAVHFSTTRHNLFVDLQGRHHLYKQSDGTSIMNPTTVAGVLHVLDCAKQHGKFGPANIMIIAFYSAQVAALKTACWDRYKREFDIRTVDSSQGDEKDVVVLDFTRPGPQLGFLNNPRRLCVAMSRAKIGLIGIGSVKMAEPKMISDEKARPRTVSERVLRDYMNYHRKWDSISQVDVTQKEQRTMTTLGAPGPKYERFGI